MATPPTQELRVGVVFPAKKIGHLRDILTETRGGVRFVLLDLHSAALATPADVATALGGRVDVLLHKLAHEMVFARLGDADAARRLRLMVEYVAQHPEVVVLDPIDSVTLLTDRQAACDMLVRLRDDSSSGSASGAPAFHVPRFHVVNGSEAQHAQLLEAVDAGRLQLPLICKSVDACATDRSHWMSVVTKRDDLVRVEYPALYQEFINHSGRLFKGYVLGELINVAERRSLPNLSRDAQRVQFDTQKQYPTAHDFHAADTATAPAPAPTAVTTATVSDAAPSSALSQDEIFAAVRAIGVRIRESLGLSLFGFDVIVSDASSELYVIDVNYFPSYRELENFGDVLCAHIRATHARQ